ncbi:hypothetical protein Esi_0293_0014 [Ectocarpus siliculosus]|uniref:Uncharacterized protein n=1 Tax=Ectocarpus siliculosus TaxID=2880 RepID=D8LKD3_ECTSI|nr:hypothetical protein Esi_0293_0014 [Ectocarpus siliculosus]|eukprot:CBN76078.1 hypothetical protein Esi_0293_0014 [Ectocarpus siliculosus]
MGGPSRNNDPNWTPQLSAFTSGDAHNGCRALFNGTAGWAYFGPAGEIDEGALPAGTVSYPYNVKGDKSGLFGVTASGSGGGGGGGGGGASQAAKKPGDDLNRKSNEMRGVYFDAKDLAHLVRGWAGDDGDDGDDDDAVQYGGGCSERGGGGEEEEGRPRKGRPIVLTLQAILAATTPTAAAAVVAADAVAAFPLNAKAAAAAAAEEETATDKDGNNYTGAAAAMPAAAAAVAGVTAADNNAQFPPLMLRDASAEKGPGLYLAPPITMVKKNGPGHPAEQLAASHEAAAVGTQGCAVSCSEAAAATSVAEATVLAAAAAAAADETAADGAAATAATTGGGGGRAADRAKSMLEDEDPYYARKRVGAFAHRTKPRGKAHK